MPGYEETRGTRAVTRPHMTMQTLYRAMEDTQDWSLSHPTKTSPIVFRIPRSALSWIIDIMIGSVLPMIDNI